MYNKDILLPISSQVPSPILNPYNSLKRLSKCVLLFSWSICVSSIDLDSNLVWAKFRALASAAPLTTQTYGIFPHPPQLCTAFSLLCESFSNLAVYKHKLTPQAISSSTCYVSFHCTHHHLPWFPYFLRVCSLSGKHVPEGQRIQFALCSGIVGDLSQLKEWKLECPFQLCKDRLTWLWDDAGWCYIC